MRGIAALDEISPMLAPAGSVACLDLIVIVSELFVSLIRDLCHVSLFRIYKKDVPLLQVK